ncbi:hypothetical protein [Fructobacillus americanaquae]|nr:hypothetical protein [Fructobacillus americanaquae]
MPMIGRLQKHEANMALLLLVALGLLTFLSGKRRRQRDDEK